MISSIIINEIKVFCQLKNPGDLNQEKLDKLLMILNLKQPDFEHCPERWAKWLRPGCPTTTNSLESIHGHINSTIPNKGSFFDRLKNVQNVIFSRFANRNQWHGYNFRNYVKKLKKIHLNEQKKLGECNCGDYNIFHANLYQNINTPCKHTIVDFCEKFPNIHFDQILPEISNQFIVNDNISVFEVKDELPENWKENNEERSREFVSKKNNYLNSLDKKYKIAWDIIYSIRNMIPKLIWKEKKEFIISIVFEE